MQAKLEIIFEDNGSISVTGPIGNKLMCYGMLEAAKDAIRTHGEQQERRIALAAPGDVLAISKKPS